MNINYRQNQDSPAKFKQFSGPWETNFNLETITS